MNTTHKHSSVSDARRVVVRASIDAARKTPNRRTELERVASGYLH